MEFSNLFNKENKGLCRWLGTFFLAMYLLFIVGDISLDYEGITGWFRQWFSIGITLMGLFGVMLIIVSFTKDKPDE